MKDIKEKEINHPAYLKLNSGDIVFTVKTDKGLSFFGEALGKIVELNEDSINQYNIELLDRLEIKSNEEIFYEFQAIANSFSSLGGIVQNDIHADIELLTEWETIFDENLKALKALKIKAKNYITSSK